MGDQDTEERLVALNQASNLWKCHVIRVHSSEAQTEIQHEALSAVLYFNRVAADLGSASMDDHPHANPSRSSESEPWVARAS